MCPTSGGRSAAASSATPSTQDAVTSSLEYRPPWTWCVRQFPTIAPVMFSSAARREPNVTSFDDPRLADLKVGVQVIGDDGANSPPVAALARRGIVGRLRGFPVYGDYSRPHPTSQIVEAVANGDIDVAIAWGPLAGYFAARQPVALRVAPVSPLVDLPMLPMIFDISMGVRRGDKSLQRDTR